MIEDKIRAYKEHRYIVFEFPDGKNVKYDLATGETIGKLGKPVKSLNSQLSGFNVYDVIDLFENENYKNYLRFVLKYFVNDKKWSWRNGAEVNRVKNVGTFLSKINKYSHFEQYFAIGIHNVHYNLTYKLSDIPKSLIKAVKQYDLRLDNALVKYYIEDSNMFNILMETELNNFTNAIRLDIFKERDFYRYGPIYTLIKEYNYNPTSLLKYIDNLITYEGLDLNNIPRELYDYARMMRGISPKYEKYPKNFLTTHKIASRNYQRFMTQFEEQLFTNRIDPTMEWKYNGFKFIYPKTSQEIKDEAVQQSTCVASYIKRVIDGECHILFLRHSDSVDQSLVTIEVKNNKVVQAKGKYNRDMTAEEAAVVDKYNNYLVKRFKQSKLKVDVINTGEMVSC